jgi:hypothetical protein
MNRARPHRRAPGNHRMRHPSAARRPFAAVAATLLALAGLGSGAAPARAETWSTCTGFVDSVPAVITTQGVWCLRRDVSTAITSGRAIEIASNNVTLDCNGFKVGGLAGGPATTAAGIYAYNRKNLTIRNCNVRGFETGIHLTGGTGTQELSAGHLVERNRVDNATRHGIVVGPGTRLLVRGNQVHDIGGKPGEVYATGITSYGDVIDNVVSGLYTVGYNAYPRGMSVFGGGHVVRGNIVRGFEVHGPDGSAQGIVVLQGRNLVTGNHVHLVPAGRGRGVWGTDASDRCHGNTLVGLDQPTYQCTTAPGNYVAPAP